MAERSNGLEREFRPKKGDMADVVTTIYVIQSDGPYRLVCDHPCFLPLLLDPP